MWIFVHVHISENETLLKSIKFDAHRKPFLPMGQYHRTLVIWVDHKSLPKLLRSLNWIVGIEWNLQVISCDQHIWTQEHFLRTFAETALFCEQFIDQGVYQPGDRLTLFDSHLYLYLYLYLYMYLHLYLYFICICILNVFVW